MASKSEKDEVIVAPSKEAPDTKSKAKDEGSDWEPPKLKDADDRKAQKEKQVEAAKVDADELDPAKSNPIVGAHLEQVEGAVDLTRFPGEAQSTQEKLEEKENQ